MPRCFIGIPVPDSYVDETTTLIARLAKQTRASMRWSKPENLHLTLRFLGDIETTQLDAVASVLNTVKSAPFIMQAVGFGGFPDMQRPRIIWLALKQGGPSCTTLADAINATLVPLGFDRPKHLLRPHLTLGRVRKSANNDWPSLLKLHRPTWPPFTATRFTLWQSDLRPDGPVYTPLNEYTIQQ